MQYVIYFILAALIGYLWGAIPFGYIYVRLTTGEDLRDHASGRTGGTNSMRAAGFWVGLLTSVSDVFKGFMGVWMTRLLFGGALGETLLPWAVIAAGSLAVIGHNWSVFLAWRRDDAGRMIYTGLRGGAGTAPNVGWSTAVWWVMLPIGFGVMGVFFLVVGMASVASMAMAAVIPIVFAVRYFSGLDPTPAYMVGGLITAATVVWALRPNIKRLLKGNERVVGPRAKRLERRQMKNAES
jgi:glycerol-3-phosphate acyltransferase PlsY